MKEKFRSFGAAVKQKADKAIDGFARLVVKKRLLFTVIFAVIFVASIVGFFFVNTNYDSTAYLPSDSEVKQGLSEMFDNFGGGGNGSVMITKTVENEQKSILFDEAKKFKQKICEIKGVDGVMWLDDLFASFTKDFNDDYTQSEYAETILLLLRLTEKVDVSDLANNETIKSLIAGIDLSDPETVIKAVDSVLATFAKKYFDEEIATGNYSFDSKKGKAIILSALAQTLKNPEFAGKIDGFGVNEAEELLHGFASSIEMFYSADENGKYSPLFQVTFVGSDYEKSTINAVDDIRTTAKNSGYGIHMSGNAATTYNSIDCVEKQTTYALIAVGAVVLVILFLFSTSFWEPVLYLAAIGIAVVINMGTNVVMGSVSYLTSGVAGILQLALSMDYSIFLLSRFKQEKEKNPDPEIAMINAIKASLSPISASSLTTIASFVALMFMSYSIGLDMGIVFTKGVIFSLASVFMLLPALAIYSNKLIVKTEHKSFKLTLYKFTGAVQKARFVLPIFLLAVIVLSAVGQNYMKFGYGDTATFGSEGSLIYEDKQAIESIFGSQNQLAALIKNDKGMQKITTVDGKEIPVEEAITTELAAKDYVITAQSASVIKSSGTDKLLPASFLKQFDNGGEYNRIVTYLDLPEEGEETEKAIKEIREIFAEYGVEKGDYYLLGGSSSALEIKEIVNKDYTTITWVSILLVMVILLVTFRNAILPVLLIFVIQGSVWISMSISVLTGDVIVFLGYMIVSAVMLGATIDYGILVTSNYLEQRKSYEKFDAIKFAVSKSSRAVLTSSLILCCAGIVLSLTSTMPAIKVFGDLISRTAASSLVLVFTLLPCLLTVFDKWIEKTTLYGGNFHKENKEKTLVAETETANSDTPEEDNLNKDEAAASTDGENE